MLGLMKTTAAAPDRNPLAAHRPLDRAASLPEEARRRLGYLAQRAEELADAAEGAHRASEQAQQRHTEARGFAEAVQARRDAGEATDADVARAAEAQQRALRSTERAAQRARDVIADLSTTRELMTAVNRFINGHPPGVMVEDRPELKLPASGGYAGLVAQYRSKAHRLQAERKQAQLAPFTAEEAKRKVRAEVEELAERGMPGVSGAAEPFVDHGDGRIQAPRIGISWPRKRLMGVEPSAHGSGNTPAVVDAEAVLAWLFKDRLIEALEADIDDAYAHGDGIDQHERHKRVRALDRQIAQTERLEAEAIWRAVEAGEDVEWRALKAAAVLGVQVDDALLHEAQQRAVSVGAGRQETTGR